MDTTTTDGGGGEQSQPEPDQASAAVTPDVETGDQLITTDDNGTPTLAPAPQGEKSETAASTDEAQAGQSTESEEQGSTETDAEIAAWADRKGLKINPDNPNEVKLARMQLENDRRFHQSTQKPPIPPPELLEETDNPDLSPLVERQNQLEVRQYVRDWFDANPELKQHRAELQQIATDRPWLTDMDDVRAHFLANPSREAQLKQAGGKEALTNLAQKQSQIPPNANATNTGVYESGQITPKNVYDLVDKNDQAWFEKNHKAISDAMAGKMPQQ